MTADELVEKTANAIDDAARGALSPAAARFYARAAIRAGHEAIQEPSAEMVSAFHEAETEDAAVGAFADTVRQNNERLCRAVWPAMLAASPLAEIARDDE